AAWTAGQNERRARTKYHVVARPPDQVVARVPDRATSRTLSLSNQTARLSSSISRGPPATDSCCGTVWLAVPLPNTSPPAMRNFPHSASTRTTAILIPPLRRLQAFSRQNLRDVQRCTR